MRYRIAHTTTYAYSEPVPVCHNKLHLAPRTTDRQTCTDYQLAVVPEPRTIQAESDFFGNRVEYFSLLTAHNGLAVTSASLVEVHDTYLPDAQASPSWEDVVQALASTPPQAAVADCLFAHSSELADPTATLEQYARQSFLPGRPIVDATQCLTRRINEDFEYNPQVTTVSTPIAEVFQQRAGVCQDFAHLQIACLRSLGLAARYVSGYVRTIPPPGQPRLVGADASHAWLSVYCGPLGWVDFDPTNNVIPTSDHVTVAIGRDYGDVCPIQGVIVGGGDHTMTVSVDVQPLDSAGFLAL